MTNSNSVQHRHRLETLSTLHRIPFPIIAPRQSCHSDRASALSLWCRFQPVVTTLCLMYTCVEDAAHANHLFVLLSQKDILR